MEYLFKRNIQGWNSWGDIFQDIPAWEELIIHIFDKEDLKFEKIENLTPGTNAVFKVGEYVVKIFAPKESGLDTTMDVQTELFSVKHAEKLGVSVPKCVVDGVIEDKYIFPYMIMDYVVGREFAEIRNKLSDDEKIDFGRRLRGITDKMNKPCRRFNDIDVVNEKGRYQRWEKYPIEFRQERLAYIKARSYGELVFVHGDLCNDNILITEDNQPCIIDFADAVSAPIIYEHSHIASELFRFDKAFLKGFFGNYNPEKLAKMCFDGLLIHDFGGDIIAQRVASAGKINSLQDMKQALYNMIK